MEDDLRFDHQRGRRHEAEFGAGEAAQFCGGDPGEVGGVMCRNGDGSGLYKPNFWKVRFVVLDEADRLC